VIVGGGGKRKPKPRTMGSKEAKRPWVIFGGYNKNHMVKGRRREEKGPFGGSHCPSKREKGLQGYGNIRRFIKGTPANMFSE